METELTWIFFSENEVNTDTAISEDGTVQPIESAIFTAKFDPEHTEVHRRMALYVLLHPRKPERRRMFFCNLFPGGLKHNHVFWES